MNSENLYRGKLPQGGARNMIKLIVFDLDGVLVPCRELHYMALNEALKEVVGEEFLISHDEHLSTYDGLPTRKKLAMLTHNMRLSVDKHDEIWVVKQQKTISLIDNMTTDYGMRTILKSLKDDGYLIYVASNSVKKTIKMMLLRRGLMEFIDEYYSNEDVSRPKPNPEIYLKCMVHAGTSPQETLVVEDSYVGRRSAIESGAYLCPVSDTSDVTEDKIRSYIENANKHEEKVKLKWRGGKMKVLIPMAGAGTRFQKDGFLLPKPLIEVNGKPMIQTVVENLNIDAQYIFVVQKEHYEKYHLKTLLNLISPGCDIVQVDGLTEGAACTALLARDLIDNSEPLLFANSDQFLEWDSNEFMYSMMAGEVDGGLVTFTATDPKWSFAKLGKDGFVEEVAEKKPISNIATAGVYYWSKGSDFVKYAEQMVNNDIRVNDEFYVCPVFNEALNDGKRVKIFPVEKMWGIGTPEDLEIFLKKYGNKNG